MFIEWLQQPWPWYVAGPLIALVMYLMLWAGASFGISDNFRIFCAMCGGESCSKFFCFDWREYQWNFVFAIGMLLGGFLAHQHFTPVESVGISEEIKQELVEYGMENPGDTYVPEEIFSWSTLSTWKGWVFLVLGGFLVGFGARYAGGCTSGHAISGLSDLQLPSLIAVIGFFIGGLLVTYLVLPWLFMAGG
ncbi:MAG: YeeE/YedE family protein [Flavobacteriales bacterium]|nr:YeeE/YedE family protein [Flavobacteriales bacterium]